MRRSQRRNVRRVATAAVIAIGVGSALLLFAASPAYAAPWDPTPCPSCESGTGPGDLANPPGPTGSKQRPPEHNVGGGGPKSGQAPPARPTRP
jgi:hypothetical protein